MLEGPDGFLLSISPNVEAASSSVWFTSWLQDGRYKSQGYMLAGSSPFQREIDRWCLSFNSKKFSQKNSPGRTVARTGSHGQ